MPRQPAGPSPTLTEIMEGVGVDWVWLYCTGPTCHHKAPLKLSIAIEQYGPDASSDVLRRNARCARCGHKGATIMNPSWGGEQVGWVPYPG